MSEPWWPLKDWQLAGIKMEPEHRAIILSRPPDRAWEDDPMPTGVKWIERRFRLFDSYPVEMERWEHRRYFAWDTPRGVLAFSIIIGDRPSERHTP